MKRSAPAFGRVAIYPLLVSRLFTGVLSGLLLGVLLCAGNGALAQDFQAYFRTDQISGAPDPGSFMVSGQSVRARLPTGGVQYSLPLVDVSGQELSLAVSLDYSYDGFRPHEAVSWVGMGWSLSGGGSITRVPFGHLDGDSPVGYRYEDSHVQSRVGNISMEQDFLHDINEGLYDSEPDVYVFQFGSYSGKFIHFKGKIHCFPDQALRITGNGDTGFVITTETGDQYTFQEPEYTHSKGSDNENYLLPTYASTWHLSRIQSASGKETIVLQYDGDGTVSQGGYFSQTYKLMDPPDGAYTTLSSFHYSYPTKVDRKRLRYIIAPSYTVSLVPGAARDDLFYVSGSSYMLGEVVVTNTQGSTVRKYKLNHGYFGSGMGYAVRYLKLASVEEIEPNPSGTPVSLTHTFEYDTESGGYPSKVLANTDRYGYYTGRGDFSTNMIPYPIHPSGPDRSISLSGTRMGALTKVTYPTGGNSQVTYAQNRKRSGTGYETNPVTYTYVADGSVPPPYGIIEEPLTPINFTIDHAQDITLDLVRVALVPYGDNYARNTVDDVEIYRVVSGTPTLVYSHAVRLESDSVGVILTKRLEPGNYRISVIRDYQERWVSCILNFSTMTNIPIPGQETGGLRVASITDQPVTGATTTRHYRYIDNAGFDTGSDARPDFGQSRFQDIIYNYGFTFRNSTIHRPVVAQAPPFSTLFYYESVDELQVAGTDTLRSRYLYREYPPEYLLPPEQYATLHYRKQPSSGWAVQRREEYSHSLLHDTAFFYVRPIHIMAVTIVGGLYGGPLWEYDYHQDMYVKVWKRLDSKRTVEYEGTDSLVTVESFQYGPNHRFPTRRVLARGAEPRLLTLHKYARDYMPIISSILVGAHVVGIPLEEQQWRLESWGTDSTLISLQVGDYHGSYFKPVTLYGLREPYIFSLNQQGKTGSLFNNLLSDSRLKTELTIGYNTSAQPILSQQAYGPAVSYRYGYPSNASLTPYFSKDMEVVLQATGATQAECFLEDFEHDPTATIGTAHTGHRYRTGSYSVTWTRPNARDYTIDYWYLQSGEWHYARQAYTGSVVLSAGTAIDDVRIYPSDASVTSYTHLPGIGMVSEIGPQGHTTYYPRDSFHRLQSILDTKGKIRQYYQYHYKN